MWFSSNKTDQPKTKENCNVANQKLINRKLKKIKSESKDKKKKRTILVGCTKIEGEKGIHRKSSIHEKYINNNLCKKKKKKKKNFLLGNRKKKCKVRFSRMFYLKLTNPQFYTTSGKVGTNLR
ncbi:unnamed protein product [Arabidopsis halleri]